MGWPENTPEEEILTTLARLGYDGAPAFPRGGRSAAHTVAVYQKCGLQPAPGYFSADYWHAEQRDEIVARARQMAQFTRAVGCTELYVATGGWNGYVGRRGLHRGEVAGRVTAEDGLTDAEWDVFTSTLTAACQAILAEGVRPCYHNHVGSVTESGAEMDRLLASIDPATLFLGPDTGHLAWAGVDVVDFIHRYAGRILTIHVKDVNNAIVTEGVAAGWDYGGYTSRGVFAELGQGDVDFPAVFATLKTAGFAGWVIVETDVITTPTAEESHAISRAYLKKLGW
jgi:inosose dehydratase